METIPETGRVLGKWSWWGIRKTHYERVAWFVFRQARRLDYEGLFEKACGLKGGEETEKTSHLLADAPLL
jgi:hypothetical protein